MAPWGQKKPGPRTRPPSRTVRSVVGRARRSRDTEDVYRTVPVSRIPWNREDPPGVLVALVETGTIVPCRCIDLGCGTGNYSVYLSLQGFTVTGMDISPSAISIARENARQKGVRCDFFTGDVRAAPQALYGSFDFAFDWEVLHHVYPNKRKRYVENVFALLRPGGTYLSVCFSDHDPQFGGSGKYRTTPLGTRLYFSSEQELDRLFSSFFRICELKTITIGGQTSPHLAVYALMKRP